MALGHLIVAFTTILQVTQGVFVTALQCYSCYYGVGNGSEAGDPLCKRAATLSDTFLEDCGNLSTSLVGTNLGDFISARIQSPWIQNQPIWKCVYFHVHGQYLGEITQDEITRACMPFGDAELQTCDLKTKSEWDEETDELSHLVSFLIAAYGSDTAVEACVCEDDKCNKCV